MVGFFVVLSVVVVVAIVVGYAWGMRLERELRTLQTHTRLEAKLSRDRATTSSPENPPT